MKYKYNISILIILMLLGARTTPGDLRVWLGCILILIRWRNWNHNKRMKIEIQKIAPMQYNIWNQTQPLKRQ